MMKSALANFTRVALLAAVVSGCGGDDKTIKEPAGLEDYSVEYKKSRQTGALEIPPGLSDSRIEDSMAVPRGGPVAYSDVGGENKQTDQRSGVLPMWQDIRVERHGDKRWLLVNAPAKQVWGRTRDFWASLGFLLTVENPEIGIMETDWKENRADIPGGIIRNFLSSVLDTVYSAPTRDSFRIRIEEGDGADQTEVFISHRGVLEKVSDDSSVWETREAEPGLEAEMLRRLMVFMGTEDKKARASLAEAGREASRASLIKDRDGNTLIDYKEGYPRAWRIVGLALDRVGFTVENRDRSNGIYYVRYSDPLKASQARQKSIMSRLVFWGDDEKPSEDQYRVTLAGDEVSTQIIVLNEAGQRDNTKTSRRILTLLHEQIE